MSSGSNAKPDWIKHLAMIENLFKDGHNDRAEFLLRGLPRDDKELISKGELLFRQFRGRDIALSDHPESVEPSGSGKTSSNLSIASWCVHALLIVSVVYLFNRGTETFPRELSSTPAVAKAEERKTLEQSVNQPRWGYRESTKDIIQFGPTSSVKIEKGSPTIDDADFKSWGKMAFSTSLKDIYSQAYKADVFLKYDDKYLYIAAAINDPYKLRNKTGEAASTIHQVYKGGSISIHFSDPSEPSKASRIDIWAHVKGDKVTAKMARFANNGGTLGDVKIIDLKNEDKTSYGVFMDGSPKYTLKYRISWKDLVGDNVALKLDHEYAFCLDIRWSNPTGDELFAKLSDVMNQDEAGKKDPTVHLSYQHPELWGKAVFVKIPDANAAATPTTTTPPSK